MTITQIEQQSRNKKRFSIFIDDEFAFGVNGDELLDFKLAVGVKLDSARIEEIKNECEYAYARDKAIRLLSVRQRSESEIKERLRNEFGGEAIERVLTLLKAYGYLDDRAFAEAYFKELSSKNKSVREIKYKLKQKGIDSLIIDEICVDGGGIEACVALLEKKYRKIGIDEADRRKALAYLAGKGFSYNDAKQAFNMFLENKSEEADYYEN